MGSARMGWVVSLDADAGDVFTLDDGTVCRLDRESGWCDFWARLLAKSWEYAWPVYVRSDAAGRVELLLHASVNTVECLLPDPGTPECVRVRLAGTDAVPVLRLDEPGRDVLARRLEEAAATGRPVVIAQDALASEIVDVRFAPDVPPRAL